MIEQLLVVSLNNRTTEQLLVVSSRRLISAVDKMSVCNMIQAAAFLLFLGQMLLGSNCFGQAFENLALNKNCTQSSTYTHGVVTGRCILAVDGISNLTTLEGADTCACTGDAAPSWWAVDLGSKLLVGRVRITSRRDISSAQLQNFYIGLTNVSPWTSAPNLDQSSVCKYFFGYPQVGRSLDIFCEPNTLPGRYLFVMMVDGNWLPLCEVEAYFK